MCDHVGSKYHRLKELTGESLTLLTVVLCSSFIVHTALQQTAKTL